MNKNVHYGFKFHAYRIASRGTIDIILDYSTQHLTTIIYFYRSLACMGKISSLHNVNELALLPNATFEPEADSTLNHTHLFLCISYHAGGTIDTIYTSRGIVSMVLLYIYTSFSRSILAPARSSRATISGKFQKAAESSAESPVCVRTSIMMSHKTMLSMQCNSKRHVYVHIYTNDSVNVHLYMYMYKVLHTQVCNVYLFICLKWSCTSS